MSKNQNATLGFYEISSPSWRHTSFFGFTQLLLGGPLSLFYHVMKHMSFMVIDSSPDRHRYTLNCFSNFLPGILFLQLLYPWCLWQLFFKTFSWTHVLRYIYWYSCAVWSLYSMCVCVCVCQLVRLVGTLMPDCVGSVANGLGCLKV